MTEYYKTLFTQNKNQRILIHDIRNHLTSIARLNEQNDHEKIRQYLNSLLNSPALQNSAYVSDNEMLNSILCHYIKLCQDKQIQFKVDIRKNYSKILIIQNSLLYSVTCWIMQLHPVKICLTHLLN